MTKISFTPLHHKHFPLLHQWMNTPHVIKWWGENRSWSLEDITKKYETYVLGYKIIDQLKAPIFGFIIRINNAPVGYIQYYNAYDFPREQGYKLKNLPKSMTAIDLYIGDVNFIGKGYGEKIINHFLTEYVWRSFDSCMVDPDLDNLDAVRTYEKCSFKAIDKITEANSLLMLRTKFE